MGNHLQNLNRTTVVSVQTSCEEDRIGSEEATKQRTFCKSQNSENCGSFESIDEENLKNERLSVENISSSSERPDDDSTCMVGEKRKLEHFQQPRSNIDQMRAANCRQQENEENFDESHIAKKDKHQTDESLVEIGKESFDAIIHAPTVEHDGNPLYDDIQQTINTTCYQILQKIVNEVVNTKEEHNNHVWDIVSAN